MEASLTGRERYRTNTQDLGWREETEEQASGNLSDTEAWVSFAGGMALLVTSLTQRYWIGAAMAMTGGALLHRGATGHCALYHTLGVSTHDFGRRKVRTGRAIKVQKTIRIERPAEELYRFWRNLENLPKVMNHLESVEVINDRLSHWVVKALRSEWPRLAWDAEIVNEVENERIGWRSLSGSQVDNAGSVRFVPEAGGRATELTVMLQYDPPAGRLGAAVAQLFGENPGRMIEHDLQRFKAMMESGQETYS